MKERRAVSGFTLVELIVVIAIIGALAAILVPSMLGYVSKARIAGMNSSAKSLYNAAMTSCREFDVIKPIPEGVYTAAAYAGGNLVEDETLNKYIYHYFSNAESVRWAVKIVNDAPVSTCVHKGVGDGYFGTYPIANDEKRTDYDLECAVNYGETGEWSRNP